MMVKIASGLERTFAQKGFAEPSVEDLREAAGVSLRTLYKYVPSRDEMIIAALEYRHQRYLDLLFSDLTDDPNEALNAIIDRTAEWMRNEAPHGCLFHAAVATSPNNPVLLNLLARHKKDLARLTARATRLANKEADLLLVLEGLMQCWPTRKEKAVESAKRIASALKSQQYEFSELKRTEVS